MRFYEFAEQGLSFETRLARGVKPIRASAAGTRRFLTSDAPHGGRMAFLSAYPREGQEVVFDAHGRAYDFFRGACQRGIYDNRMRSTADRAWERSSAGSQGSAF